MPFLYCLAALLAVYLVFFAAPAVVTYFCVFRRRYERTLDETYCPRDYYLPHRTQMLEALRSLQQAGLQEVSLTAADGVVLKADYLDGGFDKTAVLVHGYRADALNTFGVLGSDLYRRGYNLLLLCQRGHGKSGGISTLGIREQYDLLDWLAWLKQNTAVKKYLLCGSSMGCASVAYASDKVDPALVRALLLDCGYESPDSQLHDDLSKWHMPWRLLLPLIRLCANLFLHIDLTQSVQVSLARTSVPAVFLHGTADKAVPLAHGIANYNACASQKEAIFVQDASHTIGYLECTPVQKQALYSFIENQMR